MASSFDRDTELHLAGQTTYMMLRALKLKPGIGQVLAQDDQIVKIGLPNTDKSFAILKEKILNGDTVKLEEGQFVHMMAGKNNNQESVIKMAPMRIERDIALKNPLSPGRD